MRNDRRREKYEFDIAPVLEALGFENVPHITSGHRPVRCAFHGDRSPSASVSRFGFICFVCGRRGDALKLLMEEEGIGFADALERAKSITGSEGTEVRSGARWGDVLSG